MCGGCRLFSHSTRPRAAHKNGYPSCIYYVSTPRRFHSYHTTRSHCFLDSTSKPAQYYPFHNHLYCYRLPISHSCSSPPDRPPKAIPTSLHSTLRHTIRLLWAVLHPPQHRNPRHRASPHSSLGDCCGAAIPSYSPCCQNRSSRLFMRILSVSRPPSTGDSYCVLRTHWGSSFAPLHSS